MKRTILALVLVGAFALGAVGLADPAGAAPDRPDTPGVAVGSPSDHGYPSVWAVCTYVGGASGYSTTYWYVHQADSWYIHYLGHHIYQCAMRLNNALETDYSRCFWYDYERGTTGGWHWATKYHCW